jgi:hypothetical protein
MTKQFINTEWKLFRENLLFEKEKSKLPETQHLIESELEIRSINKEIFSHYNSIHKLNDKISQLKIKKPNETKFIKKCPSNCNGFLSTKWKC